MNILNKIIGKSLKIVITLAMLTASIMPANAQIVFQNEYLIENDPTTEAWIIDSGDDASGNIKLQFGNTIGESITWDATNTWFEVSNDFSFGENKIVEAEIENVSALPGGAPGLGAAGTGRIVYLDTLDSTAPGCTVDPWCPAATYIWDGSTWINLQGEASSSTLTKVVTVGSTGADYTTIDAAAAYLSTRSGGIMLLSAETHNVTTAVDLTNVTLIGKDASRSTIAIAGSGQLDSFDTYFKFLTLDVNGITDDMGIDVQSGSSALQFEWVDFDIQDSGDSLIDSNSGTAPTTTITFINCEETAGSGTLIKTQGAGNINTASDIFASSASGNSLLQLDNWDVTIEGAGNVYTTGTITTIPDNTIYVYPGMYLQGAVDSLPNGGSITLLPGTHSISSPIVITNDSIEITGYGDASLISASGFTGGDTIAAIQIGAANGTAAVDGVSLRDFKLEITGTGASDIHGIRVTGGEDNRIDNITVEKVSGTSGSGGSARIGIQMTDGTTEQLIRPVITNSRVLGSAGSYFTDGIHVTSDGDIGGVWGNDQGVENALLDGNFVDYVGETAYVFVSVENSSLFNNRASRMGGSLTGTPYGIYMGNSSNINVNANVFSGSLLTSTIAVGIEVFNAGTLKETVDSIFNNNIIDGEANGGVGFAEGFRLGNATNTNVHRNSFQNNSITGASTATTIAISVNGNADNNTFSNNNIDGGTNAWDTGITLASSTQDGNIMRGNKYTNVTALVADSGTATKIGVAHHRATSDPTVNDDAGDGYDVGTLWINTSTDDSFLLTDSTTGAANWEQINGGGSSGTPGTTLPVVQARRTTVYTLTTTATDITLNTTDIENDTSTVEHDNTNTDRIYVYEDGIYLITYDATGGGTATSTHLTYAQVRSNDTTVLPGSYTENSNYQGEYSSSSATFLADLNANDYVSLQLWRDGTTDATQNDITFSVAKMEATASSGSGSGTLDDAYDADTGERSITVDAGDVSWDITSTYNHIIDLQGTGDLQIQDGGVNFAVFDDSGDVTFSNNLTVNGSITTNTTATKYLWLDIAGAVRTSASTGSVNSGTSPVIRFDGTNNSRARWSFPIPDDWESGTDIEIEVFWSPEDGTAGNVYYELDYQSWASGETISGATTLNSIEAAPGTTLQLDSFTFTIPNTALASDDMVNIRASREPGNAADTYAGDINIHMIRINYSGKKLL